MKLKILDFGTKNMLKLAKTGVSKMKWKYHKFNTNYNNKIINFKPLLMFSGSVATFAICWKREDVHNSIIELTEYNYKRKTKTEMGKEELLDGSLESLISKINDGIESWEKVFEAALKANKIEIIRKIEQNLDELNLGIALQIICNSGNEQLFNKYTQNMTTTTLRRAAIEYAGFPRPFLDKLSFLAGKSGNPTLCLNLATNNLFKMFHETLYVSELVGACTGGHLDLVKNLSNYISDIHKTPKYMTLYLDAAIMNNKLNVIEYLIEQGAVASKDAFYYAVDQGHIESVEYLLAHGFTLIDWPFKFC